MASGKSTVGPKVAARLGCSFLDLDRLIAVRDGRSIPEIFEADGEEHFRTLETKALHQTADTEDLVVALGGGALVDEENRAFAKKHGYVIYLKVDTDTILSRVGDEADERPLLQDERGHPLSKNEMQHRIDRMLSDRESSYTEAHATVDATPPVPDVVDAVLTAVREHGRL